jgi:hypothetical protein
MKARHCPVQVAASIVEAAAGPAGDLVEIEVLAAPAARRALKPWPRLLVPHHRHADAVDQNVGGLSGELVPPVAPSEFRDRPFHERADAVELERVEACPIFDQTASGDVGRVWIVEQAKGAGHSGESNTYWPARQARQRCRQELASSR